MAKKISEKKLNDAKERILHDGSYFEKEAFELGISKDELIKQFEAFYEGGKKNTQFKAVKENSERNSSRVSKEELEKLQISAKTTRKRRTTVNTASMTEAAPTPVPTSEPEVVPTSDLIEKLIEKKNALEDDIVSKMTIVDDNKSIVAIRANTAEEAKKVLAKAQAAVEEAERELAEATQNLNQAETDLQEAETSVSKLEDDIRTLIAKALYLVEPFYKGKLPKYGTFISTEALDGVTVEKIPDAELPTATVEDILLFDFVPDYKKAREFCGLVARYKAKNVPFTLIAENESLNKLLKQLNLP